MRISLVNATKYSHLYPVGLLKIGSMLKSQGHDVTLHVAKLPPIGAADEIWVSTLFTFEIPFSLGIVREARKRAEKVRVGGIAASLLPQIFRREGVEVHVGMIPEAETHIPDYTLLDEIPEYSITHTSRGCVRNCGFCMVPRIEPEYRSREWIDDLAPDAKQILFYDNNWTAKPYKDKVRDVDLIRSLVEDGKISSIDFNQGMDCRLMTTKIADLLAGIPIKPVRFAFDGMHEDGHWQNAFRLMRERGHRDFRTYALYNYTDTPRDFYYRMKEIISMGEDLSASSDVFPMRYQPILEIGKKGEYTGRHWTKIQKMAIKKIIANHSYNGQVSCEIEEFEFWWGKNEDEFLKLISYPRLREICIRKKNELFLKRMEEGRNAKDAKILEKITDR